MFANYQFPLIMKRFNFNIVIILVFAIPAVRNGAIADTELQGLYAPDDKIVILFKDNFDSKLFNKQYAHLIEFYNSWCGHCKRFAPVWKEFAADVHQWNSVVAIGAIDCADDVNNGICREYEILEYPTLKFFHQNFVYGPEKIGERFLKRSTAHELKVELVNKLQTEQIEGRGQDWPDMKLKKYDTLANVWTDLPTNINVAYLIIDFENSTIGSEVILDLKSVLGIRISRVSNSSNLVNTFNIINFPSIVSISRDLSYTVVPLKERTRYGIRSAIISQSKNIKGIELNDFDDEQYNPISGNNEIGNMSKKDLDSADTVYQADLETALRYSLTHEITKLKYISKDSLIALQKYLLVLEKYFPFQANGKEFITELRKQVMDESVELTGEIFAKALTDLEKVHSPVYSTLPQYIGCKGSAPQFRGFTCGLWMMFHTLTVGAAEKKTMDASEVLEAIHGYVKYFFGCTECSKNFQDMAAERFKAVAEADGAIIWLWTAHNEVNHRLASDATEDPQHPKKQFPVIENCPKCRDTMGAWDIKAVLAYIKLIYGAKQVNLIGVASPLTEASTSSSFDSFLFALLYIYFAIMLLFILRLFLTKKMYRKKIYIHDYFGKV